MKRYKHSKKDNSDETNFFKIYKQFRGIIVNANVKSFNFICHQRFQESRLHITCLNGILGEIIIFTLKRDNLNFIKRSLFQKLIYNKHSKNIQQIL